MEITYGNNEYRKNVLKFIKENYRDKNDQSIGAKAFTYFINLLRKQGENTENLDYINIDTVEVRYGVIIFSGRDAIVKLKRYTDKELHDNIWMMRRCQLSN